MRIFKNIYGMAFPRSNALIRLSSLSEPLNKYVICCVVYQEERSDCMNHWIDEISSWMHEANRIKSKSRPKKRDYDDSVFGSFGTDKEDVEINLIYFRRKYCTPENELAYPNFIINDKLVNSLFKVYSKLKEISYPKLLSDNVVSKEDWKHEISNIFNK